MKSVAFLLLLGVVGFTAAEDFCSPDLCEPDEKHIACNHSGDFSKTCPEERKLINITEELQKLIVDLHNTYRNAIAGGEIENYKGATRMAAMTWSPELAKMATMHSKHCLFEHDDCHNTKTYKLSGQNLAQTWSSDKLDVITELKDMIKSWFDEKKDANMEVIKKYPKNWTKDDDIGHFTVMVQASNNAVGCSMMSMDDEDEEDMDSFMLTCDYAKTNMVDKPVYKDGSPASECTTGTHPTYKHLCSSEEIYQ